MVSNKCFSPGRRRVRGTREIWRRWSGALRRLPRCWGPVLIEFEMRVKYSVFQVATISDLRV